ACLGSKLTLSRRQVMRFDPERALVEIKREFGEHGGVCPSIERSSTFTVLEPGTMPEIFGGLRGPDKGGCFLYSRHFNPTVDVLARSLAAMEGTEYAVCTASGISAISCTLLQLCTHGDHIVASDTVYGGTHALLAETFPQMGIQTTLVDPTNVSAFEKAITPATKVLYTEVVGNPTLKVADIRALANLAHDRGIRLVVDNTFTPMVISPAQLGADVVVYSLTKFVNGASDMIAGAVCATKDFIFQLMDLHTGRVMLLGPTMDPRTAFDIYQRLPHLALRMREHSRRALAIAQRLESIGAPVVYPGLESHPQHALMRSMGNEGFGFGGLLTLDCGTVQRAEKTMSLLQNEEGFGYIAVSLGYFDTLISCSGSSTSSEIPPEDRERIGLSPGLLRIAVGYSGTLEDRMAQIERAVRKAELV
ncbi:MAG TPA: aminotransferase class I/II-fold pyridoxal phosphate-dependent enzyme, partial [Polyangiaceae bacterium]|nr:aminotransferase class I/II-fold pyridoxal phosphate-dependent enzyme [Polyangiaceae bacterium]